MLHQQEDLETQNGRKSISSRFLFSFAQIRCLRGIFSPSPPVDGRLRLTALQWGCLLQLLASGSKPTTKIAAASILHLWVFSKIKQNIVFFWYFWCSHSLFMVVMHPIFGVSACLLSWLSWGTILMRRKRNAPSARELEIPQRRKKKPSAGFLRSHFWTFMSKICFFTAAINRF